MRRPAGKSEWDSLQAPGHTPDRAFGLVTHPNDYGVNIGSLELLAELVELI